MFAGGVGGAFIASSSASAPTVALFHLALRIGASADIGAFTLGALVGPSMLASGTGSIGAIECILEMGVRF